jgi:uncharacterized coiled-coil protein SlyX
MQLQVQTRGQHASKRYSRLVPPYCWDEKYLKKKVELQEAAQVTKTLAVRSRRSLSTQLDKAAAPGNGAGVGTSPQCPPSMQKNYQDMQKELSAWKAKSAAQEVTILELKAQLEERDKTIESLQEHDDAVTKELLAHLRTNKIDF